VAGPVLGGLAIATLGYGATLIGLSVILALGTLVIGALFLPRHVLSQGRAQS